jgi:excisionase family DNA binding protein
MMRTKAETWCFSNVRRSDLITHTALKIEQVIAYAGIGRTKIYQEINAGRLKAIKAGRRTLIMADSLNAWLAALPPVASQKEAA